MSHLSLYVCLSPQCPDYWSEKRDGINSTQADLLSEQNGKGIEGVQRGDCCLEMGGMWHKAFQLPRARGLASLKCTNASSIWPRQRDKHPRPHLQIEPEKLQSPDSLGRKNNQKVPSSGPQIHSFSQGRRINLDLLGTKLAEATLRCSARSSGAGNHDVSFLISHANQDNI